MSMHSGLETPAYAGVTPEQGQVMPLIFPYYRSQAPMLWVFMALASIELFAVHLLVSLWSVTAAWILSAMSLLTILWIAALIRSFRGFPVEVGPDAVLLRLGRMREIRLALSNVESVRTHFPGEALKAEGVFDLALMAYPNILFELAEPVPGRPRKLIRAIAHRLDDPEGCASAIQRFRTDPAPAKAE
jgi:hypothetical protein